MTTRLKMKHLLFVFFLLWMSQCLLAQHVHLQTYTAFNRTAYTLTDLRTPDNYYTYGARLAVGLPKLQIGGEFERQFNDPTFLLDSLAQKERFNSTYYAGFLRWNISRYPAHRFGLVIKAGAGIQNTIKQVFDTTGTTLIESIDYPNPVPVFHAGVGFSMPIYRQIHFDLHYQFNYAARPSLQDVPAYTAAYHSIQIGISINLVFGKALEKAKADLPKWRAG